MVNVLPYDKAGDVLIKQCIRSSTSIGANYCEANDAFGDKYFLYRLGISRKEAKETTYWISLLQHCYPTYADRMFDLTDECTQLTKILSTMIKNKKNK